MTAKIDKSLAKLEKQLVKETDTNELNRIVELFNLNLQKKNIIRSAKLSEVQDKVVDEMYHRLQQNSYDLTHDELVNYHKAIQNTLDKADTTMENVKIPSIQINQQVNIGNANFNSESRKRILAAVHDIINSDEIIDLDKLEDEQE